MLVSIWHNDGSNVSTLEKKMLRIYHILEDLNYGILRIYAEFWNKNPQESTHRLSEELGASKDTILRQVKTLVKSYRSCKSVPHELTPQQAQRRVDICLSVYR